MREPIPPPIEIVFLCAFSVLLFAIISAYTVATLRDLKREKKRRTEAEKRMAVDKAGALKEYPFDPAIAFEDQIDNHYGSDINPSQF